MIQKLFGNENTANEIAQLDEQLRIAIEDIKKLEEDWHKKVAQMHEFIKNWDKKFDLTNNTQNIVYMPENPDYKVEKDKNNYTWTAVHK